jgi:hypothetical protein
MFCIMMRLSGIASWFIYLFEHDLFGKPVSTFPEHALMSEELVPIFHALAAQFNPQTARRRTVP